MFTLITREEFSHIKKVGKCASSLKKQWRIDLGFPECFEIITYDYANHIW